MDYVRISRQLANRNVDSEDLERQVSQCSGLVKMMCGVANNCAYAVVCHAWSQIADIRDRESYEEKRHHPHPGCRHKSKKMYLQFFRDWSQMESVLLYPPVGSVRFFHVDDMPPEARKKYGSMTDADYFDFWKGVGSHAYKQSQPLITSLQNKFRKSLERHNIREAGLTAWAMTAYTVLELACDTWRSVMLSCHEALPMVSKELLENIWRPFLIQRPADTWRNAMLLMAPEVDNYKLDADEERNIELGVQQLRELWISVDLPFDSTIKAVEDFDKDIFRTRGEAKKSIRELAEMREDARKDREEIKEYLKKQRYGEE